MHSEDPANFDFSEENTANYDNYFSPAARYKKEQVNNSANKKTSSRGVGAFPFQTAALSVPAKVNAVADPAEQAGGSRKETAAYNERTDSYPFYVFAGAPKSVSINKKLINMPSPQLQVGRIGGQIVKPGQGFKFDFGLGNRNMTAANLHNVNNNGVVNANKENAGSGNGRRNSGGSDQDFFQRRGPVRATRMSWR